MNLISDENGLVEYEELVQQQELRPVKHKDAKDLELRLFSEADKNKDNKLDEDEFEKFQVCQLASYFKYHKISFPVSKIFQRNETLLDRGSFPIF